MPRCCTLLAASSANDGRVFPRWSFYQKLFSRIRGENSTISWIRSVDFIANPISTRFYGSNRIVSLRLNEERRSSSAVETVCRPWTASPARTHPVEECTTRKRSRNGVSCVGAASCGPFAAWRNAAAPFQLTSPTTSTPLISPPTIITPRFLRIDCLLRAMGRRRPRPRVLVLPFKGFWRLGSDFDGCVSCGDFNRWNSLKVFGNKVYQLLL